MFTKIFTHNGPKLKTTPVSFNRCVVKQTRVHPHHEISAIKRKELLIHAKPWMNFQQMMLNEGGGESIILLVMSNSLQPHGL